MAWMTLDGWTLQEPAQELGVLALQTKHGMSELSAAVNHVVSQLNVEKLDWKPQSLMVK